MPSLFRRASRASGLPDQNHHHRGVLSPLQYTVPFQPAVVHSPTDIEVTLSKGRYYDHDHQVGAEPGVNPRSGDSTIEYDHFKQDCFIEVIDYDYEDVSFQRLTNTSFINFLKDENPSTENGEEHLPPRMVRWVNIAGIDWSVLRAVALRYNLHSLALEDILHERGHTHSKADYYPGHLFLRILCHSVEQPMHENGVTLVDPSHESADFDNTKGAAAADELEILMDGDVKTQKNDSASPSDTSFLSKPMGSSPTEAQDNKGKAKDKSDILDPAASKKFWGMSLRKRFTGLSGFGQPVRDDKRVQIEILTAGDRVRVSHEPMFIFLLRNGTVISIHPNLSLLHTAPITERLHRQDSVLRSSEDASLLVESLLDLIVDRVLEVVDEYQVKINKLEYDILLHPRMRSVRSLHILSGDLIQHKRTLEPIRTMVFGLRRYDLERCRALADNMAVENDFNSDIETQSQKGNKSQEKPKETAYSARRRRRRKQMLKTEPFLGHQAFSNGTIPSLGDPAMVEEHAMFHEYSIDRLQGEQNLRPGHKVEGYFSYKAKVYLADVADHMDFAITSIDMFASVTENLINYAFNTASYEMNRVIWWTTSQEPSHDGYYNFSTAHLLTGYFGINFQFFAAVERNSDLFFWEIAIPVMLLLVPIFMYNDIREFLRFVRRKAMFDRVS